MVETDWMDGWSVPYGYCAQCVDGVSSTQMIGTMYDRMIPISENATWGMYDD